MAERFDTEKIVKAYHRFGNKSMVARELGINRSTVQKHLKDAGEFGPIYTGTLGDITPQDMELPKGGVKRYLLTSAQNNTQLHEKFWQNLLAYKEFLNAELMVARYTYNKASYSSSKAVKPGNLPTDDDKGEAWWHYALDPYVCDDRERHGDCRYRLAPGLQWCAEMNILPTQILPLSGLNSYTGRDSAIFPHAKVAMESVASARSEATKFNYTTGSVTLRNYIKKKTGLLAEELHRYGASIVEVNEQGDWWVRQIIADESGTFYDIPDFGAKGAVKLENGDVTTGHPIEAANWGDIHASEAELEQIDIAWKGDESIIDTLQPKYQFMHDIQSFRSRSHHEMKKFGRMFKKWMGGEDSVEEEVKVTAEVLNMANREGTTMVVVSSNHDRHGERWLDEADYRKDPLNAEFFLEAQLSRVKAYRCQEDWDFNEWSLERAGVPPTTIFLKQDDSFVVCGVEMAMHGDEGPNGARGSTSNLRSLGRPVNKGHDHTATIRGNVYSAGAMQLQFVYMSGPSSHSVSHIVTYPNGSRAIITVWDGKWRA